MISQWTEVKPPVNIKVELYEFIISSLDAQFDIAVRLAAAIAIRNVLDDFEFDIGKYCCILLLNLRSRYLVKGGPSKFRFSRFLACQSRHTFILHPICPILVLKCLYGLFLQKCEKKIFLFFCNLGESPSAKNFFFRKFFFQRAIL